MTKLCTSHESKPRRVLGFASTCLTPLNVNIARGPDLRGHSWQYAAETFYQGYDALSVDTVLPKTPLFSAPAPTFAKCWLSSSSNVIGSCFDEVFRRDPTLDLSLLIHGDSVNIFRIEGRQSTPKPKVISAILHIFMSAPAQSVSSDFANCTVLFTRIAAQMVALDAYVSLDI